MDKLDNKGIIQFLLLILIAAGILVGVYLVQQQTSLKSKADVDGVNLSLQPNKVNVTSNEEFTLSIFATTTANLGVAAIELHINFDPDKVEVRSIQAGSVLPVVLGAGTVNGDEANIALGANPGRLFNGNGEIATLRVVSKDGLISQTTIQFTTQTEVVGIRQNNVASISGSLSPVIITKSDSSSKVSILANPSTHTLEAGTFGTSTISAKWTNFSQYAVICVSMDSEQQVLFASGAGSNGSLSQETKGDGDAHGWIQPEHNYTFYLYNSNTLDYQRYSSSCQGTAVAFTTVKGILSSVTEASPPPSSSDSDSDGDPDSTDCVPNDARAHHGQTSFFTEPRSNGGFDYNCDGNETQEFGITTLPDTSGTIYSHGPGDWCNASKPSGSTGFISAVPACGQRGAFRYCTKFSEANCNGTSQASDGTSCGTSISGVGAAVSWAVVDGEQNIGSVPQSCN